MVRKFLYFVAFAIVLVIASGIAIAVWWDELSEYSLVPDSEFVEQAPLAANAYDDPKLWFARPGMTGENPASWQPQWAKGKAPAPAAEAEQAPPYALFFIHPTSYIPVKYVDEMAWNASLDNADANKQALLFLKGMATPFNQAKEIWIPRYRQAVFGTFLTGDPRGDRALDAAYADVEQAFFNFLDHADPKLPIVLAGHSQGGLHLQRLLARRIAGTPLGQRIAAAYSIGWPVSLEHDLPALGLPACSSADQPGCLMSWLSFAEPADSTQMLGYYTRRPGFDGKDRTGSPILCTNPLTGTRDSGASAESNPGSLVPDIDLDSGELVPHQVGARCDEHGLLLVGAPLDLGTYVLPGNNYHVYDVPMFWRSLQLDVAHRVAAWQKAR
jgi:hypothetical protein